MEVLLPFTDRERGSMLLRMMQNETERIEALLSVYRPESEISMLNRMACKAPVPVCRETMQVLVTCKTYYDQTSGAFDVAFGRMDSVQINPGERTVTFSDEAVKLNFGGFGKGYALQRIQKMLQSFGVTKGFLNFGDSAILAIGTHTSGKPWRVGPRDPEYPGNTLAAFDLQDASMSVSATIRNRRTPVDHHQRTAAEEHRTRPVSQQLSPVSPQHGTESITHPAVHQQHSPEPDRHASDPQVNTSETRKFTPEPHLHIYDPAASGPVPCRRLVAVVDEDPLRAEILSTALLVNPELHTNLGSSNFLIKNYD
jgi:thiamine biosynthesis lipoprotein